MCIFPTAALLGLLLALPAAVRVPSRSGLDFKNLVSTLVPFVLVSVVFFSATVLTRSEEEVGFNRLMSRYNDFQNNKTYYFNPVDPRDSALANRAYAVKEAIRSGMLGDRQAVNEAFYARSGGSDWSAFVRTRLFGKVREMVSGTIREYYLLLLLNAALMWYCYRKLQSQTRRWLIIGSQAWVLLLFIVVGGLWRMPPRLAAPALVATMVNLLFFLRHRRFSLPKVPSLGWLLLASLFALHIFRTGSRALGLDARQTVNEQYLASLERRFHGQLLVGVGFEPYLTALSPWKSYGFGQNKLLMLTGWQTMAPEFREYLTELTGQSQFAPAMMALTAREKTIWIAPIGFEQRLNRLLGSVHNTRLTLLPFKPYVAGPAFDELNEYLVGVPAGRREPVGPLSGTLLPTAAPIDSPANPPATLPAPPAPRQ